MLYLLSIVNLQQVIASKLHICELLVVFEEVNREVHLAGCASCCKRQDGCFWQETFLRGKAMRKQQQNELAFFGNACASQIAMYCYRHQWEDFTHTLANT